MVKVVVLIFLEGLVDFVAELSQLAMLILKHLF